MSFFRKIRSTLSNSRRAQREVVNPVYTNDGNEGVAFTQIEETHVKRPFPSDNPQLGQSTYVPQISHFGNPRDALNNHGGLRTTFQTEETNKQPTQRAISCLKFSILTVVIFSAITAIIIVIIALRETNKPGENTDTKRTFVCNSPVQITLQNNISFNCSFTGYELKDVSIQVSSLGNNNSVNLTLEKPTQIQWSMIQTSNSALQIRGPQMLCDSPGMYQLDIITKGTINTTANISIKTPTTGNIMEVNLTLDRVTSCTTNDDVSDFYVSCAARSGCEQSSLSFLAIRDHETTYNLELPFMCSTNYTNANGWYVNCSGTINDALSKRIKEIKCHPSSGQLNESRRLLPQCNLTGNCTAKGVKLGDNIIIVCNTTFNATSVDKILSPTNKTLDKLQWNVSQNNYTITLQGPKANCSSAGEYMITTSNNVENSSQVQRVTVEIIEKTEFNNNSNCATCESYPKCQRSYILRMDSSDTSPDNSFSSNCTTTYSDSSGSITRCVGPSQWNATVSCTLFDTKTTQAKNVTKC